jgi:hypothetical protein
MKKTVYIFLLISGFCFGSNERQPNNKPAADSYAQKDASNQQMIFSFLSKNKEYFNYAGAFFLGGFIKMRRPIALCGAITSFVCAHNEKLAANIGSKLYKFGYNLLKEGTYFFEQKTEELDSRVQKREQEERNKNNSQK